MAKSSKGPRGGLTERVKTARGRKPSSANWLKRQLNDPYVRQAKIDGYRSRAAYKLIELNEKFHLLKPGETIVDLGAAPGGWLQVADQETKGQSTIIGLDILEMEPVAGATCLQADFTEQEAVDMLLALVPENGVDVVLSDIAPNTTGHQSTDHIRIMMMCELAFDFAIQVLNPGGKFVAKVLQGGTEQQLLTQMKRHFQVVKHAKPNASRKDSAETYVVATGFRE